MDLLGQSIAEVRKEAAAWLVEIDDEPEGFDVQEFVRWLRASTRHVEEFLFIAATWRAMDDMPDSDMAQIRQWLQDLGIVVPLRESVTAQSVAENDDIPTRLGIFSRLRWVASVIGVVMLGALSSSLWHEWANNQGVTFATELGEQRVVKLPDQSVMHLNTNSQVEVRFTDLDRRIRLVQGEAWFSVDHDPQRPFHVQAGDVAVQAIGTQFNVRRMAATDTIVSVIEGRVAVVPSAFLDAPSPDSAAASTFLTPSESPDVAMRAADHQTSESPMAPQALAVLAAGEQARIHVADDGDLEQRTVESVANATAWRERRLVFEGTPLTEVVAEVSRYNLAPRLVLEDEAVSVRQLTGVFSVDKPEFLIQFLEQDPTLTITRRGDAVYIRTR